MTLNYFGHILFWSLLVLTGLAASTALAGESTAYLGVSATVHNRCEIDVGDAGARLMCSKAANVGLSVGGADAVRLPLAGAQPKLIRLPADVSGGVPILVVAY